MRKPDQEFDDVLRLLLIQLSQLQKLVRKCISDYEDISVQGTGYEVDQFDPVASTVMSMSHQNWLEQYRSVILELHETIGLLRSRIHALETWRLNQ